MRDVSAKVFSLRTATARAVVTMLPETVVTIREGRVPKGDPLPVAKVAAIQAVKATPQLIPYCHTVPIEHVAVEFEVSDDRIAVEVSVKSIYKTGVEMEAMAGAMVAALNLYDILKMIDDTLEVTSVALLKKTGGKSNTSKAIGWTFGVLVVSDRISAGTRKDSSGAVLCERLEGEGGRKVGFEVVPDEVEAVRKVVEEWAANGVDFVVTTGGTGVSPRDVTPEAVSGLFTKSLTGVQDALLGYGQARNPRAMLSRLCAGVIDKTTVVCLPGSESAVRDAVDALFPYLPHVFEIVRGAGHE